MVNKRLINTGVEAAAFDPLQNFETVTYAGNSGTQKITGYIRKGAAFNGSSSKIDLGSSALKQLPMTISMWLNPITTANGAFYSNYSSSTEGFYCRVQSDGTFLIDAYNGASNRTLLNNTTGSIPDNTWSHVAITFDSSNVILYINGSETDRVSTNANGIAFTASEPTKLGVRGTSSDWYNGKIDQVRIFDEALDSSKVSELADEEYGDAKNSTTDFFGDGSGVALYQLDEDADDTGVPIDSGQSAVFNGSSSKVALSGSTSLTNRTISMWFNPSKSTNLTLLDNTQGKVNGAKQFGRWNMLFNFGGTNYAVWNEYNGSQYGMATFSYTFQVGTWYHIAFCVQSGNNAVYVNGVSQTLTVTRGTSIGTVNLADCTLGFDRDASSLCFDGKIDQVRIYSSALSASDVEALVSETNVPTANLVAHYKLDGDATDETTNYDGTWGGAEAYSDPAVRNYSGTPTNVNFLGMAFQPDFVWLRSRTQNDNHYLQDAVRGATRRIYSNSTAAEFAPDSNRFTSFDANGFTVGSDNSVNMTGEDYVAWCFKGGGAAVSNTDGSITSTVSANQDAGFSIVKFAGGNSSGTTVGHGLNTPIELLIVKNLNDSTDNWITWHKDVEQNSTSNTTFTLKGGSVLLLNSTSATIPSYSYDGQMGGTGGENLIAYCFHSVDGYQKVGTYTGTNAPNNVVTTGFRPRWIMIKSTGATNGDWNIFDTVRENEPLGDVLKANTSSNEVTEAAFVVDITDTGFELDGASGAGGTGQINSSGITYIYLAIA